MPPTHVQTETHTTNYGTHLLPCTWLAQKAKL